MVITQHDINCADTGALMICLFEETVKILMEAAAMGEKDDCCGVAENVMFGQMALMGTRLFDVTLDIEMQLSTTAYPFKTCWLPQPMVT